MAESAGAILICNSAVLQWTIQGRKEYSESEDRKRLDKDFQKKRGGGGSGGEIKKNKARKRESREGTI